MTKKLINISIKQWPEGERPREKLIQFGAERLTDAELLAILLRIGNEGASAIDMGRELIAKLGGLQGVDRATIKKCLIFKAGSNRRAWREAEEVWSDSV